MSGSPNSLNDFVSREQARAEFLAQACVERQIARLQKHFPSRDWKDEEWVKELCRMVMEFGEARTEEAIADLIRSGGRRDDGSRNTSFPPTVAEIRNCVPPVPAKQWTPSTGCRVCDDTGWKTIGEGKERRVTRCPCRKLMEA